MTQGADMSWTGQQRRARGAVCAAALILLVADPALAGPREQAKRMHDRLVGVPPAAGVLNTMEASIAGGTPLAAADQATANPLFYTSSLKNFAAPWTNQTQTVFADLNDYTALVIGVVRDDLPFTEVLSADIAYVGAPGVVAMAYSPNDNVHYEQLEQGLVDLSNPARFVRTTQSGLPGSMLAPGDTAGVLTTRAAAQAFFSGGTNRRMWRFTAMNYLCRDMEALNDITRPSDRVRQDVTRSPGGDSRVFLNTCVGCHSGMDGLAGAYANYEWDEAAGRVVYTPNAVAGKFLINATVFPGGWVTRDNSWVNYWRVGPNAILGWRGNGGSGNGMKSLGQEVASSRAFSECQVQKVFQRVCLRPPSSPADRAEVTRIANVFEAQSYSLRRVFGEAAVYCMGN